jgi:hypothetical protein
LLHQGQGQKEQQYGTEQFHMMGFCRFILNWTNVIRTAYTLIIRATKGIKKSWIIHRTRVEMPSRGD